MDDPKARLIALLEHSRDSAQEMLSGTENYADKQLHRHIEAMDLQIGVVNGARSDYGVKKKRVK
jgi:hypothetical protein